MPDEPESATEILSRLKRGIVERQREQENVAALKSIKRRLDDYEAWKRGLLQIAAIWRERAAHDDMEAQRRTDLRRIRARDAARRRRTSEPLGRRTHASGGRPRTSDTLLIRAGVSTHRNFGVTYNEIATFLVNNVAKNFLPPDLRRRVCPEGTKLQQIAKVAARLRRAASRTPVA